MPKRSLWIVAALACSLVGAGPVLATGISVQVGAGPATNFSYESYVVDEETGLSSWFATDGEGNPIVTGLPSWGGEAEGVTVVNLSGFLKQDPYVTSVVGLINPTNSTQTYTIVISLPISPGFAYNATIASSVGVTVTDTASGLVAASSVSPDGIYAGTVNGVTVLTLMGNPTSVTCNTTGCSETLDDNSGLPQLAAGPGTANSIGITLKFELSAHDQVGITSRFEIINVVPEPAMVLLVGAGLFALLATRRRAA